jgi:hypothetical protein
MAALVSQANEIFYGGAVGGGKSHLLRVASIVYSIWVPGLQVYIFRKTYKELIANHIHTPGGFLELLHDFLNDGLVKHNKSDNSFDFKNGSRIQLAHCQYDSDVQQYLGAQIGFLAVDESTHLSDHVYRYLRSRVRLGNLQVPKVHIEGVNGEQIYLPDMFPRILACSNPGNISHNFWKREFVLPGAEIDYGTWRANPEDGGMNRQFIPSRVDDNPTLIENDPGYKDRIRGMGQDHLVDAMLEGDWDIVAGGALDDLWNSSIHAIKPFRIPRTWKVDRAYDYGSSAPYGVIWFAESNGEDVEIEPGVYKSYPPGSLFLIEEIYGANDKDEGLKETPRQTARKIKMVEAITSLFKNVRSGPADNSIFDTDRGESIADLMATEGVCWVGSDKRPGSRINGLNKIRQMLANAVDREGPGLYFFRNCVNCIKFIPTVPRDEKNPEDVDTKANDHLYDVLRYKVLSIDNMPTLVEMDGY